MGLYRSVPGQQAIRAWCRDRLDGWGLTHERRELTTALGQTHVVTAGSGGPTVVLAPGTNLNAATGLDLVEALASHRRVVALDLPGQPGLSAADLLGKDRITRYGRWLDELLDHLGGVPSSSSVIRSARPSPWPPRLRTGSSASSWSIPPAW